LPARCRSAIITGLLSPNPGFMATDITLPNVNRPPICRPLGRSQRNGGRPMERPCFCCAKRCAALTSQGFHIVVPAIGTVRIMRTFRWKQLRLYRGRKQRFSKASDPTDSTLGHHARARRPVFVPHSDAAIYNLQQGSKLSYSLDIEPAAGRPYLRHRHLWTPQPWQPGPDAASPEISPSAEVTCTM